MNIYQCNSLFYKCNTHTNKAATGISDDIMNVMLKFIANKIATPFVLVAAPANQMEYPHPAVINVSGSTFR